MCECVCVFVHVCACVLLSPWSNSHKKGQFKVLEKSMNFVSQDLYEASDTILPLLLDFHHWYWMLIVVTGLLLRGPPPQPPPPPPHQPASAMVHWPVVISLDAHNTIHVLKIAAVLYFPNHLTCGSETCYCASALTPDRVFGAISRVQITVESQAPHVLFVYLKHFLSTVFFPPTPPFFFLCVCVCVCVCVL